MKLEDLYHLIRNGHVKAQDIIDTVPDPLLVLDRSLCVKSVSRAFCETFKVDGDETIGRHLYELGDGQWDIPELRRLLEDVIHNSTAVVDYEVEYDFPGLGSRTMLLTARRLSHPDNIGRSLLLSIVDATERRKREAEKDLIIGEVRHRMKNLLAMVHAMARQTSTKGRSGKEYRDAFLGRFNALVRAHDLTFSEGREIGLLELVERTLEPYAGKPRTVIVKPGPAVALVSVQILPLSLILHELATNSVKHGALSAPKGELRVHWDVEEASVRRLRLAWQERGGPPVTPPAATGFGTQLIEFAATRELGGQAALTYARAGLKVEIVAPLGQAKGEREQQADRDPATPITRDISMSDQPV
jgi:two-component sensor histidine kinase